MLRRAIERDRYGLMAYVLAARDHCTPSQCAAFAALTDRRQIVANMDGRVYDGQIARYAPQWNAPPPAAVPVAALSPSTPSGKPTNADFPTAASTPAVSIMTPEPGAAAPPPAPRPPPSTPLAIAPPSTPLAIAPLPSPRPTPSASPALAAAKKQAAPKSSTKPAGAVQLAPPAPAAPAPEADND
jgi:hypothetical protein